MCQPKDVAVPISFLRPIANKSRKSLPEELGGTYAVDASSGS